MLVFTHGLWMIKELLRQPAYLVSTLSFPTIFYLIFALPESKDVASANMLLASFSCFAVFGVLFLQFGAGVAQERSKPWYFYLKTLPVKQRSLTGARFLSAYFFALLTVSILVAVAFVFTPADFSLKKLSIFYFALLSLGLTFCMMGLCLGYVANERSALPLGNLIYLPLTFAGGLWKPPELLPEAIHKISDHLPTRHYGEILWAISLDKDLPVKSFYYLGFYLVFFSALAWTLSKREGR